MKLFNVLWITRSLEISLLLLLIVHCIERAGAAENSPVDVNKTYYQFDRKNFELLKNLLEFAFKNDVTSVNEENGDIPTDTLDGVYAECAVGLSFPCLQKKLIAFLYKLDKMKKINLIGKTVVLIRKNHDIGSDTTVLAKVADHVDQAYLKDIIDNLIEKFFDNHSLRLKIPEYFEDSENYVGEETYLDIDFGSAEPSNSPRESRRRKPDKKHKGMKKVMMLIGLLTCLKLTMMGPIMVGLLGLKAMKALVLAVISLTISKMMMLSKVNVNNLFHGNDWYSSGSGGWDRNIQETPITSTLPYSIEPPAAYGGSSY